jgi:MFS transporter, PPP family, 3-phenylpropionic acid transporter
LVTVLVAGAWFERFGMGHFPAWTALTCWRWWPACGGCPIHKEAAHHDPSHPAHLAGAAPAGGALVLRGGVLPHAAHIFIYVFFSLYLDSLGYSKTVIGLLWAVSVLIEIGWFFTQGRWLPRSVADRLAGAGGGADGAAHGLTAGLPLVWPLLLAAQALHAITFAAHHTVCIALLSHHFPGRLRGRGQALYTVVGYGLPGVIGGLGGGCCQFGAGPGQRVLLAAALAVVATWCAWRLRRLEHGSKPGA